MRIRCPACRWNPPRCRQIGEAATPRAFVSVHGNDANAASNCSLTLPCRAFAAAIGVTNPDGEVIVLDSGGYGPVTIAQSVTIQAPAGVYAGISVATGADGVSVTGSNISVTLRGLTINGQGGNRGVSVFSSGVHLTVEHCTITNMQLDGLIMFSAGGILHVSDTVVADGSTFGINMNDLNFFEGNRLTVVRNNNDGIGVANTAVATVRDSLLSENGMFGIEFFAQGATPVIGTVSRVEIHANGHGGLGVVATSTGPATIALSDSSLVGNGITTPANGTIQVNATAPSRGEVAVDRTVIQRNFGDGVLVTGTGAKATVSTSTITSNQGYALENSGGTLYSRQNNTIRGNFGTELTVQTLGTITNLTGS